MEITWWQLELDQNAVGTSALKWQFMSPYQDAEILCISELLVHGMLSQSAA